MTRQDQADLDSLMWCDGLYVGQLDVKEMRAFNRLCDRGLASRFYGGPASMMGLAKVKLEPAQQKETGE